MMDIETIQKNPFALSPSKQNPLYSAVR